MINNDQSMTDQCRNSTLKRELKDLLSFYHKKEDLNIFDRVLVGFMYHQLDKFDSVIKSLNGWYGSFYTRKLQSLSDGKKDISK